MKYKPKKYFIALDTKSYELEEGVLPVNLSWNDSVSDWIAVGKNLNKIVKEDDIIVGHSVGASIALITVKVGKLKLYSPSPIFKELKKIMKKEILDDLGEKIKELPNLSNINKDALIYVGEREHEIIIKTAEEIKKISGNDIYFIEKADHIDVIYHSGIVIRSK